MKLTSYLLLSLVFLFPSTAYADCPNCYHDQQPLDSARGHSADGRVKILVGIAVGPASHAWASPPGSFTPAPQVGTAVSSAMSMWNNARDTNGNTTRYYFDTISGTGSTSSVDIIVVKRPRVDSSGLVNPEAEMETGGSRPFKLFLREDMLGKMSAADLAGLFAHEFGHRIGLDNTNCSGTIMQGADPQPDGALRMRQNTIGAADVHMSNVNYYHATRGTCTRSDPKDNYLDGDETVSASCADADGDGITTCAGDCDDTNVNVIYSCPGSGYFPGPEYPEYAPDPGGGGGTYVIYCRDYFRNGEYIGRECRVP
jgi:hypothetical protein